MMKSLKKFFKKFDDPKIADLAPPPTTGYVEPRFKIVHAKHDEWHVFYYEDCEWKPVINYKVSFDNIAHMFFSEEDAMEAMFRQKRTLKRKYEEQIAKENHVVTEKYYD